MYNHKTLLWFRNWKPENSIVEELKNQLFGVECEFYNLTLDVTKVERGILLDIYDTNDLFCLSKILKQPITISHNIYTIEDKVQPKIYKLNLLYI